MDQPNKSLSTDQPTVYFHNEKSPTINNKYYPKPKTKLAALSYPASNNARKYSIASNNARMTGITEADDKPFLYLIGKSYESIVRKRALVKYQSQSKVIKVNL